MCLWTLVAVWVPGFTVPGEHSETPHMTLGIKQYLQVPTSTIPEKGSTTSRVHMTFYSDINSVGGAYHYPVFISVGNTA